MEQNHGPAPFSFCITVFSTILAFTFKDLQATLAFIAACVGILSGIFAARYYWLAGNEKRKKLADRIVRRVPPKMKKFISFIILTLTIGFMWNSWLWPSVVGSVATVLCLFYAYLEEPIILKPDDDFITS